MREIVAIIPNAPRNRLQYSAPFQNATTSSARPSFTNNDLPLPRNAQAQFRKLLIPMFRDYAGTLVSPWTASSEDRTVAELQFIWDIVFPDFEHMVNAHDDPVFGLVSISILYISLLNYFPLEH